MLGLHLVYNRVYFKIKSVLHIKSEHVCLFFWFGFIVPLENVSLIWRRHHYEWRAAKFYICSALMASVLHLLRHGASVYCGHLQGPLTLTHFAERSAVELSLPVFTTYIGLSRLGFEQPNFSLQNMFVVHLKFDKNETSQRKTNNFQDINGKN